MGAVSGRSRPVQAGCQSCVVGPEPPQNLLWEALAGISPTALGHGWPGDQGPAEGCGAPLAPGPWDCSYPSAAGAAGVWAEPERAAQGGASALRHPGFLASPLPGPVSSFAWPAMAAIPRRSEGK